MIEDLILIAICVAEFSLLEKVCQGKRARQRKKINTYMKEGVKYDQGD